ncbi:MAG TPA: glycerate kinase [Gaiellaceae bacterium]
MPSPSALACPASLKGVLSNVDAAAALALGFEQAGVAAVALPVADGGDGTIAALCDDVGHFDVHDAFGGRRSALVGRHADAMVVEAAQVLPLDPWRLDVFAASSRGLGELISKLTAPRLIVGLGGTATMDGGEGLLEVLGDLPAPTTVLCDVSTTYYDAPAAFGPQKGATPQDVAELERRFRANEQLAPFVELPGSGAAGGLGAALAALGAELVPGAPAILELLGFDAAGADLVVTGEGRVDATTAEGKAPAVVAARCASAGTPCVVFGGMVDAPLAGVECVRLSGVPERAAADLVELGARLGARLLDAAG